jgi:hypothetical protein
MDRRVLLTALSTTAFCWAAGIGRAQQAPEADVVLTDTLPPLPDNLAEYASEPPADYLQLVGVGTGKPDTTDINAAYDLLIDSPYNCQPVDVASYFRGIGQGSQGNDLRKFVREWPRTANPLIFHFFSATSTKPEGDTTAWCAAFVNWCIMRAHASDKEQIGKSPGGNYSKSGKLFDPANFAKYATQNASSGSFRCWKKIPKPKAGDLVVLANKGTEGLTAHCLGQGHVTFYLKDTAKPNWVSVVGGNQVLAGSNGAVTGADLYVGAGGAS